jgi:hypothetical protein
MGNATDVILNPVLNPGLSPGQACFGIVSESPANIIFLCIIWGFCPKTSSGSSE